MGAHEGLEAVGSILQRVLEGIQTPDSLGTGREGGFLPSEGPSAVLPCVQLPLWPTEAPRKAS